MTEFYSPYQFIPVDLNKTKKTPWKKGETLDANDYVRHDRWVKDSISATITCRITTLTPLAVGREQGDSTKQKPAEVTPYSYENRPAIPANSLRGMISSIAETLSQSAMRVLTAEKDSEQSVRKLIPPEGKALTEIGLLIKEGERYFIYPIGQSNNKRIKPNQDCPAGTQCYQHTDNPEMLYATMKGKTVAINAQTDQDKNKTKGILYSRGGVGVLNKEWETFLPWSGDLSHLKSKRIPVSTALVEQFEALLIQRHEKEPEPSIPYLPEGYDRIWEKGQVIKSGDLMYYQNISDMNGRRITELAYSALWRRSIGNTYQGIKETLGKDAVPWNSERDYLTPAEALFGVIEETTEKDPEKRRNLASRLHFTDAIANEGVSFSKDWITLKKLDSPKPPSPAMYYSAANGSFISKEKIDLKKHKPNGRKHYLPQAEINKKSITPWKTDSQYSSADTHKKDNWKQHLRIKPVPEQSVFIFKIKGENLSPDEFGLLLTSLEPALINDDFVHRLGMGKPYGLGQIRLDIDGIEQVNRPQRYSLSGLKSARSSTYKDDKKTRNTKLIDTTAWRELQTLANPKYSADHPVCYPFTTDQKAYSEVEGFQWFVNNEKPKGKGERDYLRKITIDESLRPLKSN